MWHTLAIQEYADAPETTVTKTDVAWPSSGVIYVAGKADTLEEGVRAAEAAVDDGSAAASLERLVEMTQELAPA